MVDLKEEAFIISVHELQTLLSKKSAGHKTCLGIIQDILDEVTLDPRIQQARGGNEKADVLDRVLSKHFNFSNYPVVTLSVVRRRIELLINHLLQLKKVENHSDQQAIRTSQIAICAILQTLIDEIIYTKVINQLRTACEKYDKHLVSKSSAGHSDNALIKKQKIVASLTNALNADCNDQRKIENFHHIITDGATTICANREAAGIKFLKAVSGIFLLIPWLIMGIHSKFVSTKKSWNFFKSHGEVFKNSTDEAASPAISLNP